MCTFSVATAANASLHHTLATARGVGEASRITLRRQRPVDGRASHLDEHEQVGKLVLDGLEAAYRSAELRAHLGVVDGHVETSRGTADLFGGQHDQRNIERGIDDGRAAAAFGQRGGPRAGEGDGRLAARRIERLERARARRRLLSAASR